MTSTPIPIATNHTHNDSFNNLLFFQFNDTGNFQMLFNETINHYVAEESSPEPSSSSSTEYLSFDSPDSKGFEVVIQNDKTLAHLIFDKQGKDIVYCELFDLEKEPPMFRLPLVLNEYHKRPLVVDHLTMLEAVRRCSSLAVGQYDWDIKKINQTTTTATPAIPGKDTTQSTPDIIQEYPHKILNQTLIPDKNSSTPIGILVTTQPIMKPQIPNGWVGEFNGQHFITFWRGILPGTKWCGLGDMADRYEDLGAKLDIDLCCRAHDHCPIRLKAFRTGYGVFNFSFYSRLHCDCDEDFYQCLKKSPNTYAAVLGQFYFNVLKVYCLKEDFFITSAAPASNTTLPQQMVCLKKKKTTLGGEECLEQVPIPDPIGSFGGGRRMKIVPFGKYF